MPEDIKNPEMEMLEAIRESCYNYRERRHEEWDENYTLYRDRIKTNRLTQRQSVNLPLMKQVIRTLLKDVDDMPVLYFENLDDDKQAELFKNEYWKYVSEINNFELQDIIDKKQVFLFGRTFDQWQIVDGMVKWTVQDPMDIYVDRNTNPHDIHSARTFLHTHIFTPLAELEKNPDYDKNAIKRLKQWYGTEMGLIKIAENTQAYSDKIKKMQDMGVDDISSPILSETYTELSMFFVMRSEGNEEEQYWVYVEADQEEILMKKRLEDIIGSTKDHFWRNHLPYESWADDLERQDFWSDGVADIVRPSNRILNAWYSQLVENRTLRNFGMHYYDATIEGFTPGTFNPVPWGWYPVPGKPTDVLQKVDIPELSESLDEMQFVINILERATGATATQQGAQVERQITLGEVQLALGEAKERIKGMSKFYTPAWKRRGLLFIKLVEAAADKLDAVKIHKKGKNTNSVYTREISPEDWMTQSGYYCRVWSQEEKNTQDTNSLQKLNVAQQIIPGNVKLQEVYQRKILEFSDLTPEEINDIMLEEEQKRDMIPTTPGVVPGAVPGGVTGQATPPETPPMMLPQVPQMTPTERPITKEIPEKKPKRRLKKKSPATSRLERIRSRVNYGQRP